MFGVSYKGFSGTSGLLFDDVENVWRTTFFLFQFLFCGTAATIISDAVAERMRFVGYLIVTAIVSAIIYPFFGHWAWAGLEVGEAHGWLRAAGFIDFAGSTVVHSIGGWVALAAVIVIGPRMGRFGPDTSPIRGHNLPMATLGVFLLWFGWFGFNGGSAYGIANELPRIFVNTFLAGVFGGVATLVICNRLLGRFDVGMIMNGALAGLVGITASADIMTPLAAVAIGTIAGGISYAATLLLERFEIDDAVGAVPVHCAAGVWGTLAVALFADPAAWNTGLSRWEQLTVQAMGVGTAFIWGFGVSFVILLLVDRLFPLRVDEASERIGLNVSEHAAINELTELLGQMEDQRVHSDFSEKVAVEPHTEIGHIAAEYNRVLDRVNLESARRNSVVEELRRETAFLTLSEEIATKINEVTAVEEVLQFCLDEICGWTQWSVGHVYMGVGRPTAELVPTNIWHLSDATKFDAFRRITMETGFAPGVGLPGRVMSTGGPLWIADVTVEPNFPRAALRDYLGLRAGFAFPILVGDEVVAVMEFFSVQVNQPDDRLLHIMAHIGTQLGRVIERERAIASLHEAKEKAEISDRTKSAFLANMSHELRTPLNAIIGFSDIISGEMYGPLGNPKYGEYVQDINDSGIHLLEVINDILDLSKIETGKSELHEKNTDVSRVVGSCLTLVKERAQEEGVAIEFDVATDLQALFVDERKLKQILINLLSNAIKFTPSGGSVTINAWAREDDGFVLTVADTGIGIDLADIPSALSPFQQIDGELNRKYEGTGLGLPLAKSLAELHGGSLDLQSMVDVGTTVTVRFPAERIVRPETQGEPSAVD
jgi:Amt family ammonium transporter